MLLRKTVDLVNACVAFFMGLFGLAWCVFSPDTSLVSGWRVFFVLVVSLALVGLNIYLVARARRGGELTRTLKVTTEGGSTSFSVAALENELVANLGRQTDIATPRITLEPQANGLPVVCRLSFRLVGRNDVLGRVDALKRQVRELFLAMFPGGLGLEIHAEVMGFSGSGQIDTPSGVATGGAAAMTAVAAKAGEEDEEKTNTEFSGPVFPIPPADEDEDGNEKQTPVEENPATEADEETSTPASPAAPAPVRDDMKYEEDEEERPV